MPLPITTVEIAFDAGVSDTSPTWTNVTSYVRHDPGIAINHWRNDEDEECSPSTLTLTLNNSDGRFTPGNASSPYSPNVKLRRRIRVRSTVNGVTYDRFNGFVNDWAVDWPGKVSSVATCLVTASSRMALLGRGSELRSIIEEEILLDAPGAYYVMNEPAGAVTASDMSGNAQRPLRAAPATTVPTFGDAIGPPTDDYTAATFSAQNGLAAPITLPPGDSVLVMGFFTVSGSATPFYLTEGPFETDSPRLELVMVPQPRLRMRESLTPDVDAVVTGSTTPENGSIVHLAGRATNVAGTVTLEIFLDGVLDGTNTTALTLGDYSELRLGVIYQGIAAHVAVFRGDEVSDDRIAAHAAAGLTGFAGETVEDRLTRYASFAQVDSSETDFETGRVPDLAHVDTAGQSALAMMRRVEVTEGGVLFDALDGTLTFHDRAHRYTATSAFTVSYSGYEVANALSPVLDDRQMCNDLTATSSSGILARRFDQDSIDENGVYREVLDLATTNQDEPDHRAAWVVSRYAEPEARVSAVEILLNSASNTLAAGVLSAEVGTRFTLSGLPSNAPASSMDLFVEGRSEQITATEDRVTLRTSPASVFDVFTLDHATRGVLDGTYPLAY